MYVANSKQMKAYDQALLNEGYSIEELVDKASDCLIKYFGSYEHIVILCGPGNNGADGLSLGIKLAYQKKEVSFFCVGNVSKLSQANKYYLERARNMDLPIVFVDDNNFELLEQALCHCDVIVDALFGFGLNSEIRGITRPVIEEVNKQYNVDVIAVDIPTGLHCDTGVPFQTVILATKTITLTAYKQAFLNEETRMYTGDIVLETLDAKDLREEVGLCRLVSHAWIKYHLKPRLYHGHKGDYGRVLHITGCKYYRGASVLSSRASVYSGSGIVCVYSCDEVLNAVGCITPECTLKYRGDKIKEDDFKQMDAILLGCGLGLDVSSYQIVLDTLKYAKVPLVIDADALTILSQNTNLLKEVKVPVILTPHIGEFRRLVSFEDELDMIDVARKFALEHHVILVLKGPNTIITDGNEIYRNVTANKAMATAGMGDVLAGMIVSFVGQGYSVKNAAIIATYLHGKCGDEIAKTDYTVLPNRLIERIPKQMNLILEE